MLHFFPPNIRHVQIDAAPKNEIQAVQSYFLNSCVLWLDQIHSAVVIDADILGENNALPKADAVVCSKKNLVITIQTADCVPVLLSSDDGKIIAGAHCGWRGAQSDILAATIDAMRKKGARNIMALIGPSIFADSYEVDENFYSSFLFEDRFNVAFFTPSTKKTHYMFDLRGYVAKKLEKCGVKKIHRIEHNTYTEPQYPSYRRNCHKGNPVVDKVIISTLEII